MRTGRREKRKKRGWVEGELTALHLIAHITAVVPAITLQLFGDADARAAGELFGASCSQKQRKGKRKGAEERKKKKERKTMMTN